MSKAPKHDVVAVVVTYNRSDLLLKCLDALSSQDCDVLIVDNASTDGTKEKIAKFTKKSQFIYENTGKNLGGAGGFNYGMRRAVELGYEYAWVMDDDCIVQEDSLKALKDADKKLNGKYGWLSSKVLWKDGSLCIMNKQKRTFSKWLKDFDTDLQPIAMASFVSLFIKTKIIRLYGLPIKDFFIWTDDWEWTRRVSRNEKCYYISTSTVTHECKENIGATIATAPKERLERFKYMYRNDRVLYRREGARGSVLLFLRILKHSLSIVRYAKDKRKRLSLMYTSLLSGKNYCPDIEYARQKLVVDNSLVSIIIPVYNQQRYLRACLDSTLRQTYNNLEIIIVDDGSTDESSKISDEYARIHSSIRVIHKANGGLSSARNAGIAESRGRFLIFLDSDDFYSPDAVEILYNNIQHTKSDIAVGQIFEYYTDRQYKKIKRRFEENNIRHSSTTVFSKEDALIKLMYAHDIQNTAVAMLYDRDLFNTIKYPNGVLYEDLATTYLLFDQCNKVCVSSDILYAYNRTNRNSITATDFSPRRMDGLKAAEDEFSYVVKKSGSTAEHAAMYRVLYESIDIISEIPLFSRTYSRYKSTCWKNICQYRDLCMHDDNLSKKQKAYVASSYFGPVGIRIMKIIRTVRKRGI